MSTVIISVLGSGTVKPWSLYLLSSSIIYSPILSLLPYPLPLMISLRLLPNLILLSLGVSKLVNGQQDFRDDDNGGKDHASATTSAPPSSTTAAVGGTTTSGLTGDSQCPGSRFMCITATVNGSTVTYDMQSQDSKMGWMAIGFGNQMAGSPMVIMWLNADNTITLSQRQANGEVMPTPVQSPPRVASVATPAPNALNGPLSKLTFTIPASDTSQSHIWAFGTTRPSSDSGATLQQHLESGTVSLDLSKPISSGSSSPTTSSSGPPLSVPLLPYQKTIIVHAAFATLGFLVLLPLGALLARYTRTYSSKWFTGHWFIQGVLGGVFVIVGCILGFVATKQQGSDTKSRHKTLGKVLLALYLSQAFLGLFIHCVKISFGSRRPPQNYVHAILGLATIGLALYQVKLGYTQEWPNTTGRGSVSRSINIVWMVWVVLLPVLYFGGLAYLPRQLRQEKGYNGNPEKLQRSDSE